MPKDRVVLITNVEHFVGTPVAAEVAAQGATMVCHDASFKNEETADAYAAANPNFSVTRMQAPADIVADVTRMQGRIDVVICNDAGAAVRAPIEAASPDDLRSALEEMVVFPFQMAGAVVPQMKERKNGKILFITSRIPGNTFFLTERRLALKIPNTLSMISISQRNIFCLMVKK